MPYYTKVVDEETGEETYVEVADADLTLPADVMRQRVFDHDEFKKVREESIRRKRQLQELRRSAGADEEGDDASPEEAPLEKKPTQAVGEPLDVDKLYAEFRQRLSQDEQAAVAAATQRRDTLNALLQQHKLGVDALPILENSADPAATALALSKSKYRFDEAPGGNPAAPDSEVLLGNLMKRLNLD